MITLLLTFITLVHADASPFFGDLENFKDRNLNLKTEAQNLLASKDLLLSRSLFWTPKLSISFNKNRTRINNANVTDDDSISGDIQLNLFKGGADWNKMKGAKAQNSAQELQVLNENLRVEVKASDLIFKSLYITESKRIEEQLLKLKEESFKIVKDRYGQGKIPLQEVTKAEVDLVQQKNKLRNAVLELSENKSQINSLFISTVQTKFWPFSEKTILKLSDSSKMPVTEQKFWIGQSKEHAWRATKGLHWPSPLFLDC